MKHIYNPKQPTDVPTPYVVVTLLVDDVIINANRFVSLYHKYNIVNL
jgi:hypothetical protein